MQISEFKLVVKTFADPGTDLLFDKNDIVVTVNGADITGKIIARAGDVFIDEGTGEIPASKWILTRLAQLPILARRLRESVPKTEHFVSPAVSLLSTLERRPDGASMESDDGLKTASEALDLPSPLETLVLYITSDAGEGKTSLINQLASEQAQRYLDGRAEWLLVPISLGGRHFLRFDDITVGVLQNRYRFPFLYYQSFLALVKMGVVVPAFDGFEEMFVENSSGEALSAIGILVSSLDSRGAMVVAARKAYFEFENLRTQQRLFETINGYSVGFGKLELRRWAKPQFITYCSKRGVPNPEELYRRVSDRLTPEHALLTRAVLVKRLVDVSTRYPSLDEFLDKLQKSGTDFFSVFVRGLIEREANEKWLDRAGEKDVATPLLTISEHFELLSQVALSMWDAKVDYLKRDALEFVAEYFCEVTSKNAFQAQQVRERIRGHAMLVPSTNAIGAVEFDHDEFRLFFLGEGIARLIVPMTARSKVDVLATFRRGSIPSDAMHALVRSLARGGPPDRVQVADFLLGVASLDAQASYTSENVSELLLLAISNMEGESVTISGQSFGHDALRDKKLANLIFQKCIFLATSLELAQLKQCSFIDCKFVHLRLTESTSFDDVSFQRCEIDAVTAVSGQRELRGPSDIQMLLQQIGATFDSAETIATPPVAPKPADPEFSDLEKIVRYFTRSTHISESVVLMKLGVRGQLFIDKSLPALMKRGVFEEIRNQGGADQRRFRLGVTLQQVTDALVAGGGNFQDFLAHFKQTS